MWQDVMMDGPLFEQMLREEVVPAIQKKMSWARTVNLQFDNAPGHLTKGKKEDAHSGIASRIADALKPPMVNGRRTGPQVKLFRQEANSPCTNKNDLGFYNSIDSRLPKLRKFSLDELYQQVVDAFWEYPSEKLDALARMKARVCKAIIKSGGDNDFKLPRKEESEE